MTPPEPSSPLAPVVVGVLPVPVIDHDTDPVQSDTPWLDPLALAAAWLPGPGEDRMLMTVSTTGLDGAPDARTTMLSDFDGQRFHFHTDAQSAKAAELARDPRVALTLLWPGFTRQLVVHGTAARCNQEEADAAYRLRSPYLQQLAWQNTPDFASLPLGERRARWAAFLEAHGGPDAPAFTPPDSWAGFAVTPHRLTFWVSNPAAASRRLSYVRNEDTWDMTPLPG
ncbi:pyridoxamine 5'-phosphate oxidase [Quadrisphaera granulorum]|uniref:Pyridoxamine 5'-phosphate oxidase n=1 Tax=Quadrisphaera granulorum TaxID=317664 RepID=A0A316AAV4_9ACTN|nr:pyridoxamine 5'-phosphate oxidase family protein [Quadrisphaera granulorum]PWJ53984.1 pyridoxamine 5'-phosphate oxidase [Quadrisphaera granulorum]SZE96441.1 pyridoxamine 5'-phosphate oxidase [Quadrisphaera granulorum]